jgi:diguanylate cyclase (GGDEF)-like protein
MAKPARIALLRLHWLFVFMAIGAVAIACTKRVHASDPPALLHGAWLAAQPGDTPAGVMREAESGRFHVFDTQRLETIPRGALGTWVLLQPRAPGLQGARVLSIPSPPFGSVTLYDRDGPLSTTSPTTLDPDLKAHGRIAFALPQAWSSTAPILLKFEHTDNLNTPVRFVLATRAEFRRVDTLWIVMASASLAVMLAMGLVALCFSSMLGDTTFAWYAAYVCSYAGLQAVQTGFVFQPLHLAFIQPIALSIGSALTAIAMISAVLFMVRFCDLRQHAPWLRRLLLALAGMMTMLATLQVFDLPITREIMHALFNPLLALCSGLMVLAGSVALLRGSRPALFFLFGWLPLLVLTALTSIQVSGGLAHVEWLNEASLAAGAIEALVLAIGLADRSLTMRRDHHIARELADKDPLTGVLNRRGWIDAAQKHMQDTQQTHAILFMDLDHFKTLNDELGHGAGDQALIAMAGNLATELRPQDLLGRFGGEEFVALLSGTDSNNALLVAQRLCRRLHRLEIPLDHRGNLLIVSIGLATRRPNDTLSSLVERADAAMYTAKSRGRNRVVDERQVETARRPVLRPSRAAPDMTDTDPPRRSEQSV